MHHNSTVWSTGLQVCLIPASISDMLRHANGVLWLLRPHCRAWLFLSSESHQAAAAWWRRLSTLLQATREEKVHWIPPSLKLFHYVWHSEPSAQAGIKAGANPWLLEGFNREKEILVQALCWQDKPTSSAYQSLKVELALHASKDRWQLN